jgi:hypothetical protein
MTQFDNINATLGAFDDVQGSTGHVVAGADVAGLGLPFYLAPYGGGLTPMPYVRTIFFEFELVSRDLDEDLAEEIRSSLFALLMDWSIIRPDTP